MTERSTLCPEEKMATLVTAMKQDPAQVLRTAESLLEAYPADPRLHFLKGSMLAGLEDYAGARTAMRRAVDLAPDFVVARFQLGFLLLTSGEGHAAQEAWGPLHGLPQDNYVHLFVTGLCHLIRDEFEPAIRDLEDGMARNTENPPMNRDMQMIIDGIRNKPGKPTGGEPSPVSSVDFLLQQSAYKSTRH